ncbi:ABC transporter substrate-binding protein [Sedimentibacter sp. MB31-C6]|uniref:ABC transporter substrate-binding protein n=1 Tax=Sedimentibacter sp. MB31-C6 TaxID=3109366 RepID=UPI002DDD37EF|nr:helical backbone metal receptor [Sedimentibacter sp. MB36-C1]WSI03903.1 helical backbone metal receptor [Sedimentibacter sp. MB36-C1]
MTKKLLYILIVLIMIFFLGSCQNKEEPEDVEHEVSEKSEIYPLRIIDDYGVEINIESTPKKIASGAPSTTEIIYALDKEELLVGVTSYCNYPSEVSEKEIIGDYNGPNIEKLIEYGVELYITDWIDEEIRGQLNAAGIKTVVIYPSTYEAIYERIELLGSILDSKDKADELVANIKDKTAEILEKVKGEEGKRVFFENWHDPLGTVGQGSFIDEMITMSGGENISGDMQSSYGEFSSELLIERNPEVYLTTDDGFKTIDDIKERPGYNEIEAIKNDRIYFLDPDITSRPGPRIVIALESIAKAIYPDKFD